MKIIKHKFRDNKIHEKTEVLIIGTFNPDVENNDANYFYSRSKNYLWRILPFCFSEKDLKEEGKEEKIKFIEKHKISFIDLFQEINVEENIKMNFSDTFLESKINSCKWTDIIFTIKNNPLINKVCFTRKSFSGIPEIKNSIQLVENYCNKNNIKFEYLVTPARFYSENKLNLWKTFITNNK